MEKALLVTVSLRDRPDGWTREDSAGELRELAVSCGLLPVGERFVASVRPSPALLIGKGKAEELAAWVRDHAPDVAVFSRDLAPSQQRNLEELLSCKTIDRTQLILDVFARRARSQEGKVQVELAQLHYLLPRLSGKGVLLSRLGGGVGTRGPGEQKLEMDRRRIRDRIRHLEDALGRLHARRASTRRKRAEGGVPAAALVGYTNAGKSTLFNAFTRSGVAVEDRLFSTLDPTVRRFVLPNRQPVLLIDTVGFLHRLPHHLIDAFRATLEEAAEADLLLHVMDASRPDAARLAASVEEVLALLGAASRPRLAVLNKSDRLDEAGRARCRAEWPDGVFVSALDGSGLPALARRIEEAFGARRAEEEFRIPADRPDLLARIHREGQVLERRDGPDGTVVRARLDPRTAAFLRRSLEGGRKRD
jgi:GTP-binding protein HflX